MNYSLCFRITVKVIAVISGLLVNIMLHAQQKTIPLNRFFSHEIERSLLLDSSRQVHAASKPWVENKLDLTKVTGYAKDSIKVYHDVGDKLYRQHLVALRKDDFFIALDPLFDLSVGTDLADMTPYRDTVLLRNNTRGVQVIGDLGKTFSFQTGFYESQSFLPLYQKNFADSTLVIPGFGRWKSHKVVGYDYAMAYGLLSYSLREWVNLQFGHGKNFIGHGYRSLLLSDAAFNYPYLKSTLYLFRGKLQYTTFYASMQTLERLPLGEVPEALYKRKGASFNYLSWLPHPRIELGLFEGIIWKRYDDDSGTQPQPWGAYVPIIGFNTAMNSLDGENNVLLGANLKITLGHHAFVYGQVVVDDPSQGAMGYQVGGKYFNLLLRNLDVQVEWNSLGDNLYASHYRLQSYTHTNQPLGHPTGPATDELLFITNYRWHRVLVQMKYNYSTHSTSPAGSWRNDPTVEDAAIAPWPYRLVQQWDLSAGVYLNPKTNLQLLAGWTDRLEKIDYNWQTDVSQHTSMIYLALRTNLVNRYTDF